MMLRAAEILFRRKLLLALPSIIILPMTVALALWPGIPLWQTTTRIWVQQDAPVYTDPRLGPAPALNQAALLNDFLHSRSFALAILDQTGLKPQLATDAQTTKVLAKFDKDWVAVKAVSNEFVEIDVTMPDRNLSYQTMQAIISQYRSTLDTQQQTVNQQALKLYGDSLQQAQTDVTRAQNDLSTYLSSHSSPLSAAGQQLLTPGDANLGLLTDQFTAAQTTYNNARDQYLKAESAGALSGTFAPFEFSVVDPPQPPLQPMKPHLIERVKVPAIGFALAVLISGISAAFLVWSDRTVIGAFDVEHVLGLPVLGEVPVLGLYRGRRRGGVRGIIRVLLSEPARRHALMAHRADQPYGGS